MPVIAAAIIGGVATAAGGYMSSRSSAKSVAAANAMSQASTREQMDFQRDMASSAHQREVADLRGAGLNPILSGTGGAGAAVPSGASTRFESQGDTSGGRGLSEAGKGVSSAMMAKAQMDLIKAQTEKTQEESFNTKQTGYMLEAEANAKVPAWMLESQKGKYMLGDDTALTDRQRQQYDVELERPRQELQNLKQQFIRGEYGLDEVRVKLKQMAQELKIGETAVQRARIESEIMSGGKGELLKYIEIFSNIYHKLK